MKRLAYAALLVLTVLLGGALTSPAQTISGVIAGTVRDPQGGALATASVTVTNPSTGRTYLASTDANGYYRIPEVPPGVYVV